MTLIAIFLIFAGVPARSTIVRDSKYGLHRLEIGDSILIIDPKDQKKIVSAFCYFAKRNSRKFKSLTLPEGRRNAWTGQKGYGKHSRMKAVIREFLKREPMAFGQTYRSAVLACYGTLDKPIAELRLEIIQEAS